MNVFENFQNLGKIKQDFAEYEYPLDPDITTKNLEPHDKKTFSNYFFIGCVLVIFSVFIIRLFNLQIVKGQENQFLADGNRIRIEEYRAPRGIIYDKNMNSLVKNIPLYNLEIYPIDLPKELSERVKIYETIQDTTKENIKDLIDKIETEKIYSPEPIVVKAYLEKEEAMQYEIAFNDLAGVRISVMPSRLYDSTLGISHILGYIGKITDQQLKNNTNNYVISDFIGQTGLESSYEQYLRGEKGRNKVEVDSIGKIQRQLENILPIPGNDLLTTIDIKLQEKTAQIVADKIKFLQESGKTEVKHAVVVALDPKNGGVLTMVSVPSYDNNLFSKGIKTDDYNNLLQDSAKPMINRAISGIYPSGSIIKPFIAAAALDKGTVSEHTAINDPGEIKIGEWTFVDWKNHGIVDVRKAIAESCNVFFYAIGGGWEDIKGIGSEAIKEYLNRFGFGKKTDILLDGEQSGNVPDADWKKEVKGEDWYLGDTYHMSIGQGDILVTPLQMVAALSAIANGGTLYQPYFVQKVINKEGEIVKSMEPTILNDKIVDNPYSIEVVRQGMKQAVDSSSGSARQLQDLPVSSAGKTGTAQYDGTDLKKTHSWFEAFAPYDDPEIAIIVLVEGGGDGFDAAEPIAKDILQFFFENR